MNYKYNFEGGFSNYNAGTVGSFRFTPGLINLNAETYLKRLYLTSYWQDQTNNRLYQIDGLIIDCFFEDSSFSIIPFCSGQPSTVNGALSSITNANVNGAGNIAVSVASNTDGWNNPGFKTVLPWNSMAFNIRYVLPQGVALPASFNIAWFLEIVLADDFKN